MEVTSQSVTAAPSQVLPDTTDGTPYAVPKRLRPAALAMNVWPSLQWRYLLLLPVAAAIVHLTATFIAMSDLSGSAYHRLLPALPLNVMQVLQPIAPDHQPLPFLSADARYAICRFSSAQGPVDVTALLPDRGWTLGIYHPDGSAAYFAAGASARPASVAVTVLPGHDRFDRLPPLTPGTGATASVPLTVAAREGLVIVRAPDRGQAYRRAIEDVLAAAKCKARAF
jgi:uncharacterized membrane protein